MQSLWLLLSNVRRAASTAWVGTAGYVSAQVYVRVTGGSSADVVARLCDVHPDGKSYNLCDGITRLAVNEAAPADAQTEKPTEAPFPFMRQDTVHPSVQVDAHEAPSSTHGGQVEETKGTPADGGVVLARVDMWLTANVFRRGHRIRVQVCSGQHPRWARNLGTGDGDPVEGAATQETSAVHVEVYHDLNQPSQVILPVVGAGLSSHGSQAELSSLPRSRSQALLNLMSETSRKLSVQNFSQM